MTYTIRTNDTTTRHANTLDEVYGILETNNFFGDAYTVYDDKGNVVREGSKRDA